MIARRWRLGTALLPYAFLLAGCTAPEPQAPAETYSSRGVIRQLPSGADKTVFIHHEAIPEFRDQEGQVVGMNAMAMPFPVTDPRQLDGLAVGDPVSFEFEISWTGSPPMKLTKIDELPADTALTLTAEGAEDPVTDSDHSDAHDGHSMDHSAHSIDHSEHSPDAEQTDSEDHSGHE